MKTRTFSTVMEIVLMALLALTIGACMHGSPSVGVSGDELSGTATLVVSMASSRASAVPLQGASLPASGSVYIFTSDGSGATSPTGVAQVSYWLDNTAMSGTPTHVESFAPYDFVGTADDGSAEALSAASLTPGTHTITQTVTPTSGSAQTSTSSFTIGSTGSTFTLLVSTSSSRGSPTSLNGATLSGSAYVFTSDATRGISPAGITQVRYWLDNTAMSGTPTHIENLPPYDYAGTADDGSAEAWTTSGVSAGKHTITQSVTPASGAVQNLTASFTVSASDGGGGGGGGGGTSGGTGVCSPTASGPGGAGAANVAGSNVPAFPTLGSAYTVTGLDASGNADVGSIIQAAVNAHSQVIIPGSGSFASPSKYNVKTAVNVPAGVILECEPGAEFQDSTACTDSMPGLFIWSGTASVTGAGMYGCGFRGTAANIAVPTSYNHVFIRLQSAKNFTIEGNHTTNSCGDADIRLDGPENSASDHGSTGNLVAFNDTEFAENGIAIINGWNNTVRCNTSFNGGLLDEEPNQAFAQCGENLITQNYMALTQDPPGSYWSGFSVGGNGTSCPAGSGVCATDTVTDNVLNSGGFVQPSRVYCECNEAGDACDNSKFGGTWSGNILTGGTSCRCGDACSD